MKKSLTPQIKIPAPVIPELHEILHMYQIMPDRFPKPIEDMLPVLTEFIEKGWVPEEMQENFQNQDFYAGMFLFSLREVYIKKFGFTLLNQNLVNELSSQLIQESVVDIGAGTGFLSSCLKSNNINVLAIDEHALDTNTYSFAQHHTEIEIANGVEFLKKRHNKQQFSSVILAWPNYDTEFATEILSEMRKGQKLYYVGEGYGGCTASDSFYDLLDEKTVRNQPLTDNLQAHSMRWPGVHDDWYVYDIVK